MAKNTKLNKPIKMSGEQLGEQIDNLTLNLRKDVRQGSEEVVAKVMLQKQRFNTVKNYVFCYQQNFHNLVVKLKQTEMKVASALLVLCKYGNLVNVSKQLIAEVAEVHPSHISTIFRGLIKYGFLIEKTQAIPSISGKLTNAKCTYINPVFITKGDTDMFFGLEREGEGITLAEGIEAALKAESPIQLVETYKKEKKVEKISQEIRAKQKAKELEEEREFRKKQMDLLDAFEADQVKEAVQEHILDKEEMINF